MTALRKLCPLILLTPLCAGSTPSSDTVNERIPVSPAELEAHWRVDCKSLSINLASFIARQGGGEGCYLEPSLHQQLQLCAFIYQPPGESISHTCPDYQGALDTLERATVDTRCPQLGKFMNQGKPCAPDLPEN
jgi:hypothetical protein